MKLFILFILFSPAFSYDDELFRNYYMPVAASAYSDNPSQCWSSIKKSAYSNNPNVIFPIYRKYTVKCDSLNDTCSAYIATSNQYGNEGLAIYIVFRGTNNNYAFFENGWNYDEMVPFIVGGKVSKVFFDAFNAIWNAGMRDDLLTLKNKNPSCFFYFVGHSLGGAMASLAAATFTTMNSKYGVDLWTFGQPRIGDKQFADAFNEMVSSGLSPYRNIHKADIVPHLPPLNQSAYYHHGYEYWYNNDMGKNDNITYCNAIDENPECSDSLIPSEYNMKDHKNYFGRDFIQYGIDGCPDLVTSKCTHIRNALKKRFSNFKT